MAEILFAIAIVAAPVVLLLATLAIFGSLLVGMAHAAASGGLVRRSS